MANILQSDIHRFFNNSGAGFTAAQLVSVNGFTLQHRSQTAQLALASNTNRRADGIVDRAIGNNSMGFYYRDYILEGTAAAPVNTAAAANNDPIFLDPTVAGAWTLTRPSGSAQDVQEIGAVIAVNAVTGIIRLNLQSGGTSGLAGGVLTDDRFSSSPLRDIGQAAQGYVRLGGAVTDGDRIAISGRIYEFDTAAPPGAIGAGAHVRVGVSGGGGDQANTGAGCVAALVAAINADASRTVNTVNAGGDTAILGATTLSGGAQTLTAPINAGGNLFLSAATLVGEEAASSQIRHTKRYSIVAADVTALAVSLGTSEIVLSVFPSTSTPIITGIKAQRAGAILNLTDAIVQIRQLNAAFSAVVYAEPTGGALLAAADRISVDLVFRG